ILVDGDGLSVVDQLYQLPHGSAEGIGKGTRNQLIRRCYPLPPIELANHTDVNITTEDDQALLRTRNLVCFQGRKQTISTGLRFGMRPSIGEITVLRRIRYAQLSKPIRNVEEGHTDHHTDDVV